MTETQLATDGLRERGWWLLVLDSAFCIVRAIFSLEQIRDGFHGTANEIGGLAILAALVIVTIRAGVVTSSGRDPGARLPTCAVRLAVVSLCWELLWTWLHLDSIAYGDIVATCLLIPVRLVWNGIYAAVVIDTRKSANNTP